ncbi:MAG: hypothetical protein C0624_11150 [Desulfuromonas sp.]|nr:MAG: hypothetical protein C0624_11150 [Desulfuromonas sp.]
MKRRIKIILFAAFTSLLLIASPSFAVDQLGLFELDGNATDGITSTADDWETLYNGGGSANVFTGVTPDPSPLSIFTGGRKDIQDIDQWGYKTGAVPDKSDITNAYAAAYDDNGDLIIYFGADRFTNAGDTFLGFWFFQQEIGLDNGSFTGLHTPGDTLVLVNFPQAANAVPLIQVVEWDPSCSKASSNNPQVGECAAANLKLRAGVEGAGAICSDNVDPQYACAISNTEGGANDPTASPWDYLSKDGLINMFPYETFFSGGINISELIGIDVCFASFMAESRSSSSFTASLKDFVLDSFPVCSISVTKDCTNPRFNPADNTIIYDITGVVTNDGIGTVYNIQITDTPPFDSPIPAIASLGSGASEPYAGTMSVPLVKNGTGDTITATANTNQDGISGTQLTATAKDTCPNLQISPALAISKDCTTSLTLTDSTPIYVAAQVNVTGEVCNVGDTRVDNVSVTDDKSGLLLSGVSLKAPADPANPGETEGACMNYSGSYLPDEALDAVQTATTDPTAVLFTDTATANGTDIFGNAVTEQTDMAECPLCP